MNIYFDEGQAVSDEIRRKMEQAAVYAVQLENLDEQRCELSVTFVDLDEIHELNKIHRGVDSPTDVLSFPQFEDVCEEAPEEGEICLGDVVICRDKAAQQAEEFGHSFEREILYLFVHSVLHLLGYDHMEDDEKRVMRTREEKIMEHIDVLREER
ncbi:MAG: rRNA maturation RNase YbeY [Firmicutes bacterium]|nr:rRNA maturation RNase YbeY [Bacillota bacterium]MDY5771713.1 rRNA maturation RNase YbeY [Anaerovoracaceae bacterium]